MRVTDNDRRGLLRSTLEVPFSRGSLLVSHLQVSQRRRAFPRQSGCVHAGLMKRAGKPIGSVTLIRNVSPTSEAQWTSHASPMYHASTPQYPFCYAVT